MNLAIHGLLGYAFMPGLQQASYETGAEGGDRTLKVSQQVLSLPRLPVSPQPQINMTAALCRIDFILVTVPTFRRMFSGQSWCVSPDSNRDPFGALFESAASANSSQRRKTWRARADSNRRYGLRRAESCSLNDRLETFGSSCVLAVAALAQATSIRTQAKILRGGGPKTFGRQSESPTLICRFVADRRVCWTNRP